VCGLAVPRRPEQRAGQAAGAALPGAAPTSRDPRGLSPPRWKARARARTGSAPLFEGCRYPPGAAGAGADLATKSGCAPPPLPEHVTRRGVGEGRSASRGGECVYFPSRPLEFTVSFGGRAGGEAARRRGAGDAAGRETAPGKRRRCRPGPGWPPSSLPARPRGFPAASRALPGRREGLWAAGRVFKKIRGKTGEGGVGGHPGAAWQPEPPRPLWRGPPLARRARVRAVLRGTQAGGAEGRSGCWSATVSWVRTRVPGFGPKPKWKKWVFLQPGVAALSASL